jgi:hypothetical protein
LYGAYFAAVHIALRIHGNAFAHRSVAAQVGGAADVIVKWEQKKPNG